MPIYPDEIVTDEAKCSWLYQQCPNSTDSETFNCTPKSEYTNADGLYGKCPEVVISEGPEVHDHNIKTNYTYDFFGHEIPIVKTTRTHLHSFARKTSTPQKIKRLNHYYIACNWTDAKYIASISENCVIEKSTLHYLDIDNKVCLYKCVKEWVEFSGSSSQVAKVMPGGLLGAVYYHHKIKIPRKAEQESYAKGLEEWRLVVNGNVAVISSVSYNIQAMPNTEPYMPQNGLGKFTECQSGAAKDYYIFVFPWLLSADIMLDQECLCNGWYEYRGFDTADNTLNDDDGGFCDMFYPQWCRALHQDPFWAAAKQDRLSMSYSKGIYENINNTKYTPPPISVDPIPKGSFVKHPILGDLYQFCTTDRSGNTWLTQSQNLTSKLQKLVSVSDNLLIYPIGIL